MEFSCCLQLHNDPVVVEESEDTALVERNENFRADFFQSRSDCLSIERPARGDP